MERTQEKIYYENDRARLKATISDSELADYVAALEAIAFAGYEAWGKVLMGDSHVDAQEALDTLYDDLVRVDFMVAVAEEAQS